MLTVNRISKSYNTQLILKNISFSINAGERWGLVGINGCGKTTLVKIIMGLEKPDSGTVCFSPANLRIGYLPQGFDCFENQTVGEYLDAIQGGESQINAELEALSLEISRNLQDLSLQERYDLTLARLVSASENAGRAEAILPALGLAELNRNQKAATLSGGQKTRLALAGVLITGPQLLILDEPTNHLDLNMLTWLEDWLSYQQGSVLMISHDRVFLDRTVTGIFELDEQTHQLKTYAGNYSDYISQKNAEWETHWQDYRDQQDEIRRLKRAAERVRSRARNNPNGKTSDGDKFAKGFFANRTLETMRRAKSIEKRVGHLQTDEKVEKPRDTWQIKMEFEDVKEGARDALVMDNMAIGYGQTVLLHSLNLVVRNGARTVMVGENGSGKTTLFKTLMGEIPALAGQFRFGSQIKPGYMAQEDQAKWFKKDAFTTISEVTSLSETEARRFLSFYLFTGDEVFIPVENLSFGERARLSLACLVAQGCNFLLLDEPTNHLDIPSRERFEKALNRFEGTVLAISHDRYFIDQFASEIWDVNSETIKTILMVLD